MHWELGQLVASNTVDHVIPHKGNALLFWDTSNWQALCDTCHNSSKQHTERTGHTRGCDANGTPLDPTHHWHSKAS